MGGEEKKKGRVVGEGREDGGEKRCAVSNFFLRMCDWALWAAGTQDWSGLWALDSRLGTG